jgi:hypothetical protein
VPARVMVQAARDIAVGEQLQFSYLGEGDDGTLLPTAERQRLLRSQYRFTCACRACCSK